VPLTPLLGALRRFVLRRAADPTGVSGPGLVAAGVQLPSGKCVMEWAPPSGITLHASAAELIAIHGHGGATVLEWIDEASDA